MSSQRPQLHIKKREGGGGGGGERWRGKRRGGGGGRRGKREKGDAHIHSPTKERYVQLFIKIEKMVHYFPGQK